MQSVLAALVEELSNERIELKCVNDLAFGNVAPIEVTHALSAHQSRAACPWSLFVPYRIAVKHKPQVSAGY